MSYFVHKWKIKQKLLVKYNTNQNYDVIEILRFYDADDWYYFKVLKSSGTLEEMKCYHNGFDYERRIRDGIPVNNITLNLYG